MGIMSTYRSHFILNFLSVLLNNFGRWFCVIAFLLGGSYFSGLLCTVTDENHDHQQCLKAACL